METITDRAQAYWETLDPDIYIDADELFDIAKTKQDMGEDIKFIRSFLTKKFNDGEAFLLPNQSPPTYLKLEKKIPVVQYCQRIYNSLPDGEEMTIKSFTNRLPLTMQRSVKGVQNFFHRAKIGGSLANLYEENGEIKKEGKGRHKVIVTKKISDIFELPPMGRLPKKTPTQIDPAKAIFSMKASDVGMSIFELLHKLMTENKDQAESIKILKETLNGSMKSHDSIVKDYNNLLDEMRDYKNAVEELSASETKLQKELSICKNELKEYKAKDKTYEELFREKQGELS